MDYKIRKNLLGRREVEFRCTACGEKVLCPLEDAGTRQMCPTCGTMHACPGEREKLNTKPAVLTDAANQVGAIGGQSRAKADSETQYLVRCADGSQLGPLSADVLRQLVAKGLVSPLDKVARAGDSQFISAWKVRGLFPDEQIESAIKQHDVTDPKRSSAQVDESESHLHQGEGPRGSANSASNSDKGADNSIGIEPDAPDILYWYMFGGQVLGPRPMVYLKGRAAAGEIRSSTPIAPSPTGPWTKAKFIAELRAHLRVDETIEARPISIGDAKIRGRALLIVPALAGTMNAVGIVFGAWSLWIVPIACVVLTAVLAWWDARALGITRRAHDGSRQTGAIGWGVCMVLMWIIAYPAYMYRRAALGTENLLGAAIVAVVIFVGLPIGAGSLFPRLPELASPEVTQAICDALKQSAGSRQLIEAGLLDASNFELFQVSFNGFPQKRSGLINVQSPAGKVMVSVALMWEDRVASKILVVVGKEYPDAMK